MRQRLKRVRARWWALNADVSATRGGLEATHEELTAMRTELGTLPGDVVELRTQVEALRHELAAARAAGDVGRGLNDLRHGRLLEILQVITDQEADSRRRLAAARSTEEYARAYSDPDPLVSIVIPTYTNWPLLVERTLPSVLAQTHANIEVVVVGEASPPETERALADVDDPRVVFERLAVRGPYPEHEVDAWNISGVPPFNAGLRRARGAWIVPFADDDHLRPDAVATCLEAVRAHRHEFCYGAVQSVQPDGDGPLYRTFPPQHGKFTLQGAMLHGSLRFFEQEISDYLFEMPNDWAWTRRMWRAGVRLGFVDHVLADYFPSRHWNPPG